MSAASGPSAVSLDRRRRKRRRPGGSSNASSSSSACPSTLATAAAAATTVLALASMATTSWAWSVPAPTALGRLPLQCRGLPSHPLRSSYAGRAAAGTGAGAGAAGRVARALAMRGDDGSPPPRPSRGGLGGAGLTREKAIVGAIGGGLGVWGIVTAARNLNEAESRSVGARSFLWRPTGGAKGPMVDGGSGGAGGGTAAGRATGPATVTTTEVGGGLSGPGLSLTPQGVFSLGFVTYLARFLLNFDSSVKAWWGQEVVPAVPRAYGRASRERQTFLMSRFGEFSTTVELGLAPFAAKGSEGAKQFCQRLADRYIGPNTEAYPRATPEGRRIREQLALLFSLLPPEAQPTALIRDILASLPPPSGTARIFQVETLGAGQSQVLMDQTVRGMGQDPLMLLPARNMVPFPVNPVTGLPLAQPTATAAAAAGDSQQSEEQPPPPQQALAPLPPGAYYRVPGLQAVLESAYASSSSAASTAKAKAKAAADAARAKAAAEAAAESSPFGPIAARPVMKERTLDLKTYLLFALAGAVGCAGTHTLVVPIDVVKTRAQTKSKSKNKAGRQPGPQPQAEVVEKKPGIVAGVAALAREEGVEGLFRGIEPTVLGYLFYGVTVYPGYEFFKRALNSAVGPAAASVYHAPLVILAGALATVIACLGVCPAEAVRIRMVANSESFGETMAAARAQEGGLPSLWDGFPPLLVRQVLFGMMKFLVFDSFAAAVFAAAPGLRETVATSLAVSLVSGGVAGVASAVVSQPADTILSRMNADRRPSLPEAVAAVWRDAGPAGFFVGLGSRCLWSGSIISGQFLLYDVFRNLLHVTQDDLETYMDVIGSFQ